MNPRLDRQLFLAHVAQTTNDPMLLQVTKGEGIYLYDAEARSYVDFISGIGVSLLGHGHPSIVEAIHTQSSKYLHTMVYGEHVQHPQVAYAELLCKHLPDSLNNVYFVNSGSECIDAAMKLAKRYTGRKKMVAWRGAYHGSSHAAMSLMDNTYFTGPFRPLVPEIDFISMNALPELATIDERTAAVFVETIQGEAGYLVPDFEYMQALRARCDATGALLIMDEIQVGFGRTGKLWAFEHFGIEPDVLCLGKSIGGGLPLAAFVADEKIMRVLQDNPILGHITTFGGNPLSCAAGLAMFQALLDSDLITEVEAKGKLVQRCFEAQAKVTGFTGLGLVLKAQLDATVDAQAFFKACWAAGVLVDWFLFEDQAFRILPPLVITKEQIEETCKKINLVLDQI